MRATALAIAGLFAAVVWGVALVGRRRTVRAMEVAAFVSVLPVTWLAGVVGAVVAPPRWLPGGVGGLSVRRPRPPSLVDVGWLAGLAVGAVAATIPRRRHVFTPTRRP